MPVAGCMSSRMRLASTDGKRFNRFVLLAILVLLAVIAARGHTCPSSCSRRPAPGRSSRAAPSRTKSVPPSRSSSAYRPASPWHRSKSGRVPLERHFERCGTVSPTLPGGVKLAITGRRNVMFFSMNSSLARRRTPLLTSFRPLSVAEQADLMDQDFPQGEPFRRNQAPCLTPPSPAAQTLGPSATGVRRRHIREHGFTP
jgi:hypothetical protein